MMVRVDEPRTLTLTEFLTARFDEDEWSARHMQVEAGDFGEETIGYEWVAFALRDQAWERVARQPNHATPARVLAEVEAKRRIVKSMGKRLPPDVAYHAHRVLALLALPYADHVDYVERWRL